MKVKVTNSTPLQLDWLVAKARGFDVYHSAMLNGHIMHGFWVSGYYPGDWNSWVPLSKIAATTDWAQGGPIIERENIGVVPQNEGSLRRCAFRTTRDGEVFYHYGATVLIAAMRCYITSKLGEEVEIPEALS